MQNTVNSRVLDASRREKQRNIKHKRKNLHGKHPRSGVTTENFGCYLSMHCFLPGTRVCSTIWINSFKFI